MEIQHGHEGRRGRVLMVPAETVHAVRYVGSGNATELATYVVENDKPLLNLAK